MYTCIHTYKHLVCMYTYQDITFVFALSEEGKERKGKEVCFLCICRADKKRERVTRTTTTTRTHQSAYKMIPTLYRTIPYHKYNIIIFQPPLSDPAFHINDESLFTWVYFISCITYHTYSSCANTRNDTERNSSGGLN